MGPNGVQRGTSVPLGAAQARGVLGRESARDELHVFHEFKVFLPLHAL